MIGIGEPVDDIEMMPAGLFDHAGSCAEPGPDIAEERVLADEFRALGAPLSAIYRMELSEGSVTKISWFPDGLASMRHFNLVP